MSIQINAGFKIAHFYCWCQKQCVSQRNRENEKMQLCPPVTPGVLHTYFFPASVRFSFFIIRRRALEWKFVCPIFVQIGLEIEDCGCTYAHDILRIVPSFKVSMFSLKSVCPGSNKWNPESDILKTKSNLTLFITKYFYTCIDLIKIYYFICFQRLISTEFIRVVSCKWFHYRVICTFI